MSKPQSVRLPVEPLLEATGAVHAVARQRSGKNLSAESCSAPVTSLARMISVRPRTIHRWIVEGGIPFYSADKAANRVGLHPSAVWDEYWTASFLQGEIDDRPRSKAAKPLRSRMLLVRDYGRVERHKARRLERVS